MKKTHSLVLVFLAGAFGAMLRHMLTVGLRSRGIDEWFAILGVNLAAGLVAGFVITISSNVHASNFKKYETVVISGFLGGFSTVAAVSWLNYQLMFVDAQIAFAAVFLFCAYSVAFLCAKLGQFIASSLSSRAKHQQKVHPNDN
jgi:fluoride ion exporter CrcB/FEX